MQAVAQSLLFALCGPWSCWRKTAVLGSQQFGLVPAAPSIEWACALVVCFRKRLGLGRPRFVSPRRRNVLVGRVVAGELDTSSARAYAVEALAWAACIAV
jgi:hypothetical protein